MKKSKLIYICLFALLYLCVSVVSTIHAISFFSLANMTALAVMLAIAFEIGQAAVLFDILTNPNDRKKFMPWALMCLLTFVQVLGNVYSSYKYLIINSIDNLRFFKDPIFVWTTIPDEMANVILTYLIGGLLPIISLALSEMVTARLSEEDNVAQESNDEDKIEREIKQETKEDVEESTPVEVPTLSEAIAEKAKYTPEPVEQIKEVEEQSEEVKDETPTTEESSKQNSHFINL